MGNTKRQGDLAQVAFLYRAMKMGLIVSEPYGDNGRYDFAVDNGKRFRRMQVKSTASVYRKTQYSVNIGRHTAKGAVAYTKAEIDGFAVLMEPENRWYLFPVEAARGRVGLKIYRGERGKTGEFGKYLENWEWLLR